MNKRLRRYLPPDTVLLALPDREIVDICDQLNATPRKYLGFRTPAEAFREHLVAQIGGDAMKPDHTCRNGVRTWSAK